MTDLQQFIYDFLQSEGGFCTGRVIAQRLGRKNDTLTPYDRTCLKEMVLMGVLETHFEIIGTVKKVAVYRVKGD